MSKNKDDPRIKAQRIYGYYRPIEMALFEEMRNKPVDWYGRATVMRFSDVQKRRVFAEKLI